MPESPDQSRNRESKPARPAPLAVPGLIGVLVLGCAQIVSTYGVLTETMDEPFHIAAGMEWVQYGRYTVEMLHPPLARVAVAIGPYLAGERLEGPEIARPRRTGTDILHGRATPDSPMEYYFRNLSLARLGVLPFFIVTVVVVWLWTRRLYGDLAAFFGTLLFATLPSVLAHSGLATTDMPAVGTFMCAMLAFIPWARRPGTGPSVVLGLAWGLAILTKFSNILFLPACMLLVLVLRALTGESRFREWFRGSLVWGGTALLVIWAGYLFTIQPIAPADQPNHEEVDKLVGRSGPLHDTAHFILAARIWPLKELAFGLSDLARKNLRPHESYFLGKTRESGAWYFFPTVLAFKTPIPFWILVAAGIVIIRRRAEPDLLIPLIVAAAILALSMTSKINLGIRHVLAVYPFLAVIGGIGAASLWSGADNALRRGTRWGPVCLCVLLAWQVASTIRTNPDYLPYANEWAGGHWEWLSDSDLDWGQDLDRLAVELETRGIRQVHLAYFGPADVSRHELPEFERLVPDEPVSGWVAVSMMELQHEPGFAWLAAYEPVARAGTSIRLYDVP